MGKTDGMTFLQKIDYYWYYYKWHTIVILCLIIAIVATLVSCLNKVEPDLSVLLVSDVSISENEEQAFKDKYSRYIKDINGDGKKTIDVTLVQFSNYSTKTMNPELEYASEEHLKANIMSAQNQLIIFKDNVREYLEDFGTFADLSKYDNDVGYFKMDSDDKELLDLVVSDYYVGVRITPSKAIKQKGEELKMYDNAYIVLENMIK